KLRVRDNRYGPVDQDTRDQGIGEQRHLDFHSPYGCSKGTADQYVLDYARSYRLPAMVFRMSCIYGPHQCGNEDQGWVAHFILQSLSGQPITIFGDGKQVRDLLYVDVLVEALLLARARASELKGSAFNIGGGPANATSLLEVLDWIGELRGEAVDVRFQDWRVGDQRYYVSDTRAFEAAAGWSPGTQARDGVGRLYRWLQETTGGVAVNTTAVEGSVR
ncbi:MAG TPA: NAD-dependent epimerase/dehydratase family protein, partial [Bryobacteraceae bacterium]|nr:NAD-dependent epimerase/dehydratase family protein [Bryobacteraceae bacterium]